MSSVSSEIEPRLGDSPGPSSASASDKSSLPGPLLSPVRLQLGLLIALFLVSRLAIIAAGVRFDISPLSGSNNPSNPQPWQFLDPGLLRHHLLASIWNLHAQPPLFNLFCGVILKLPEAIQLPVAFAAYALITLGMAVCLFLVLVDLRLGRWVAFALSALFIADPTYMLYEFTFSYSVPTAAALTISAFCLVRYLRTRRRKWGIAFGVAVSAVGLMNSNYQMVWIVGGILVIGLIGLGRDYRAWITVALFPIVLVGGWTIKDRIQFGTVTTSSWLGMNWTRTTLDSVSQAQIEAMVRNHVLGPIAEIAAFSPVSSYVPRYATLPHGGVAALDAPTKASGEPNMNNKIYIAVSSRYLQQDLAFIRAHPAHYLNTVSDAGRLWMVPPDEFAFRLPIRDPIQPWAEFFDRTVLLRPSAHPAPIIATLAPHAGPAASQLSYTNVFVYVCTIVGAPLVIWRRRREDPATAATLSYLWLTTTYVILVTSFIEFGENQRFAMELGPLPLVAAAVVVTTVVRGHLPGIRKHRHAISPAGVAVSSQV